MLSLHSLVCFLNGSGHLSFLVAMQNTWQKYLNIWFRISGYQGRESKMNYVAAGTWEVCVREGEVEYVPVGCRIELLTCWWIRKPRTVPEVESGLPP